MTTSIRLLAATLALAAAPAFAQSSSFLPWTTVGDATKTASQLTLTTAGPGETTVSSAPAVAWFDLEGPLNTVLDGDTFEGSAATTTFTFSAPTTVSFKWTFNQASDALNLGRAYLVIDGSNSWLAYGKVATAQSGVFSQTFAAGTFSLGLAIVDVGTVDGVSTLALSDLQVAAVPEPATALTMLAGLLATAAAVRRRRA